MGWRYLRLSEVLALYQAVMQATGGAAGLRDLGALMAALAQPRQTYAGEDLYPTLAAKAGALAYSLMQNHPFLDGNKRIAHAAMEVFLVLNGYEIQADIEEQERVFKTVAAGQLSRAAFIAWVEKHMVPLSGRTAKGPTA